MWKKWVVAVVTIGLASSGAVVGAAAPETHDLPIALDLVLPAQSTDASGRALRLNETSLVDDPAEVSFTGATAEGTPVFLVAQRALPAEASEAKPIAVAPEQLAIAQQARGDVPNELLAPYSPNGEAATLSLGFKADELAYDPDLLEPTFAFAVTPTTSSFRWVPNEAAVAFQILRDKEIVGRTSEAEFSESGLDESHRYEYELVSYDSAGSVVSHRTIPVETLSSHLGRREEVAVPLTYQPYATAFTYETFIADAQVSLGFMETLGCGQAGFPNRTFGGDNRSWVTPFAAPWDTPNYRTMLFANVNWDNPAPYDLIIEGGIAATRLYDSGTLVETRTATFDNTDIYDTYKSGSYAQTRWDHSVGNPFCIAGAITYDIVVRFYRSGTIEIEGWRWPVPNHEAYGRWDNGSGEFWNSMYLASNSGFNCLTGICGDETILVSETH